MRQLVITKQVTHRDERSTGLYFQEINKFPLIGPEEEVELAVRIRKGDDLALKKLVTANLRFVISVAKQYQNKGLSLPDLINQGNLGLVNAAKKFDETKGFKFISYAVWWIRQSIMQAIFEQTRVVRLPLNRLTDINKIVNALPKIEQEYQREPTDYEISEFLNINYEKVKAANLIKKRQVSFDKPIKNNGDENFSLYDITNNENTSSPDKKLLLDSDKQVIKQALKKLDKREARILTLIYGLDNVDSITVYDVANELNTSTERVRQIKNLALEKLKNILTKSHFSEFY